MQYTSQIEKLQRLWLGNPHGTTFAPLAEAYRKAGMFEDALGALEIGLSRHPKYFPGHIVLGRCYLDLKEAGKAEEAFLKVLELDAENVIALKALADLAELHGQRESAIERLERLLDLDPANDDALAQLARVKAEPVVVVAPIAEPEPPADAEEAPAEEAPAEEAPIGQGEVSRGDLDVQLFQPIELIPLESTEYQTPNDADSLRIREPGPGAVVDEPGPPEEEPVHLAVVLPDAPAESLAALEAIRWASDDPDLNPVAEEAEPEPVELAIEELEPVADEGPVEAAVAPVEPPPVEAAPAPVAAAPVDTTPRRLTFEPTLLQLPVIPPLAPVPPARPVPPAPVAEEPAAVPVEPAPDLPAMAEAFDDLAEPEPDAVAALAEDPVPAAGYFGGSAELEPPAEPEPERLTVAAEPPAAIPAAAAGPEPPAAEEPARTADAEVAPAAEVPTMAAILAGAAVPEPVAEDEAPAATEQELVVTETMAEIFLRQGHTELALAVYAQLAAREPGNERIEAAKARLQTEAVAPAPAPARAAPVRRLAVATTGGRPATAWLAQVLSVGPPAVAPPVLPPAFEPPPAPEPTRAATDTLSLSSVFGEETAPPTPADSSQPTEESGPSFDEFFGTPPEPAPIDHEAPSGTGKPIEDLEQFNAWLKGLKR